MKIYWKNLIWNYTGRYWWKLKFIKKSKSWKRFYCSKLIWNSKQKDELEKKIKEKMLTIEWQIWNNPFIDIL